MCNSLTFNVRVIDEEGAVYACKCGGVPTPTLGANSEVREREDGGSNVGSQGWFRGGPRSPTPTPMRKQNVDFETFSCPFNQTRVYFTYLQPKGLAHFL